MPRPKICPPAHPKSHLRAVDTTKTYLWEVPSPGLIMSQPQPPAHPNFGRDGPSPYTLKTNPKFYPSAPLLNIIGSIPSPPSQECHAFSRLVHNTGLLRTNEKELITGMAVSQHYPIYEEYLPKSPPKHGQNAV